MQINATEHFESLHVLNEVSHCEDPGKIAILPPVIVAGHLA